MKSIQIKSNVGFWWEGKPEYLGKNLSWQSREPTNSIHIWHRVQKLNPGHIGGRQVLSPLGQPCHPSEEEPTNWTHTWYIALNLEPCNFGWRRVFSLLGQPNWCMLLTFFCQFIRFYLGNGVIIFIIVLCRFGDVCIWEKSYFNSSLSSISLCFCKKEGILCIWS